jgi:Fe-S-cluster containining protein
MSEKFNCKQCGKCCKGKDFVIKATPEDIERWETQERQDILDYVSVIDLESFEDFGVYDMFVDKEICPFLIEVKNGLYECLIQNTKPLFCRNYPENDVCIRVEKEKIIK